MAKEVMGGTVMAGDGATTAWDTQLHSVHIQCSVVP
jgi:hypothetical protein